MNISVLLPAYNAAQTIEATINTVLRQTTAPLEFIIVDDGSTDETPDIVRRFGCRITLISTRNQGPAAARNTLCASASGDLLAFLDADDLWHPKHLETHSALAKSYPQTVAIFTNHINFSGYGEFQWDGRSSSPESEEVIPALDFFERYHRSPGPFSCMSFCSVPKTTLQMLNSEPFQANGAEDYYFFTRMALLGPVAYSPVETVAYRFHSASLSSNKLRVVGIAVQVYELMEQDYRDYPDKRFYRAFRSAFASKRRHYAKLLMGANSVALARNELRRSLSQCLSPSSVAKSAGLLALTYFPHNFRPRWPDSTRTGIVR